MSQLPILAKPHWQHFLHLPQFQDLATPELTAADDFFTFVARHGLATPTAADVALWAREQPGRTPADCLGRLRRTMAVCIPDFAPMIEEAARIVCAVSPPKAAQKDKILSEIDRRPAMQEPWDPIAPPSRKPPKARNVSVQPWELPADWQTSLRLAAQGLSRNGTCVSPQIVLRMREKLCQMAWAAQGAGLPVEISTKTVDLYQAVLIARFSARPNGVRWATIRASIEELHRFARYTGAAPELIRFLSDRYGLLMARENAQKALKFFELARTGNTTDKVIDMADALLEGVCAFEKPIKRHRVRNGACILALYPTAPLRNASANLVFGLTLFWRDGEWVIDTHIQKTQSWNPENFVMPLEPETGRFIDAVLLGDASEALLPELRREAITAQRQLFVLPDGSPTAPSYIPRIFKALTGNSLTITRTMLHTDLAIIDGASGPETAMVACHQVGHDIRRKYQAEQVSRHAVANRQRAASSRRAAHFAKLGPLDLSFLEIDET